MLVRDSEERRGCSVLVHAIIVGFVLGCGLDLGSSNALACCKVSRVVLGKSILKKAKGAKKK